MKRKVFSILFALVLVLGLSLVTAVPVGAQGGEVWVDDDWAGTTPGEDPDDGGPATSFGTDAFAIIQDGIVAVDPGGIVNVMDGEYAEEIVIYKSLTLMGQSRAGVIIEGGTFTQDNAKGIWINSSNVTVKDFTVQNFGPHWCYSILAIEQVDNDGGAHPRDIATEEKTLIPLDNVRIEDVNFANNTTGPYLVFSKNSTVQGCIIDNHLDDGIWMSWGCDNARIVDNDVIGSGDQGIWLGAHWGGGIPPPVTKGGVIKDNIVSGAREAGIWFAGEGCTISNNEVTNIAGEGYSNGAVTLGVAQATSNVVMQYNNIHHNSTYGIGISPASSVTATHINFNNIRDNIHDNLGYGLNNQASASVDATNNWWGDDSGPYHATLNRGGTGDEVRGNVDLDPWLSWEVGGATVGMTGEMPQIVAISVTPTSIDFGTLRPGQNSARIELTISNIGTVNAAVTTLVYNDQEAEAGFFYDHLHLFYPAAEPAKANAYATSLAVGGAAAEPLAQVIVPGNYAAVGVVTGTLVFVAAP